MSVEDVVRLSVFSIGLDAEAAEKLIVALIQPMTDLLRQERELTARFVESSQATTRKLLAAAIRSRGEP